MHYDFEQHMIARDTVRRALEILPDREIDVLIERIIHEKTYRRISEEWGSITFERVRQLERHALRNAERHLFNIEHQLPSRFGKGWTYKPKPKPEPEPEDQDQHVIVWRELSRLHSVFERQDQHDQHVMCWNHHREVQRRLMWLQYHYARQDDRDADREDALRRFFNLCQGLPP